MTFVISGFTNQSSKILTLMIIVFVSNAPEPNRTSKAATASIMLSVSNLSPPSDGKRLFGQVNGVQKRTCRRNTGQRVGCTSTSPTCALLALFARPCSMLVTFFTKKCPPAVPAVDGLIWRPGQSRVHQSSISSPVFFHNSLSSVLPAQ